MILKIFSIKKEAGYERRFKQSTILFEDFYCEKKNNIYLQYISKLKPDEVLPGVKEFIEDARKQGYLIALGSASKNAIIILENIGLINLFDTIIDGNKVTNAKPDPEVFVKGAEALGLLPPECIVFEDSAAGILAAHACQMAVVGIGNQNILKEADICISGFEDRTVEKLITDCKRGNLV